MLNAILGTISLLIAACAAPSLSLEQANARAQHDGRCVAVAVLPACCRPCEIDARAQLADAALQDWLARRAWLVEYDSVRDAPGLPCWEHGPVAALTLARADGSEVACSSWYEEPGERLMHFEEIVSGDDSASVRRTDAYARGEDPGSRQHRASKLAERGESARALEEYLWCFDHGLEVDSSYCGVRLSFLLSDLEELADTYPPAAQAFEELMSRAEAAIASDPADFDAWQELGSLAYWRGNGERVLACVERLDHRRPLRVKIRLLLLEDWLALLLRTGRHAEVYWLCAGSPLDVATHWMATFEAEEAMLEAHLAETCETEDTPGMFGVTPRELRKIRAEQRLSVVTRQVAGLYTVELALAHERGAEALLQPAVAFAPNPAVYLELAGCAEALERRDLAAQILRAGLASLPAAETAELTAGLERLESSAK